MSVVTERRRSAGGRSVEMGEGDHAGGPRRLPASELADDELLRRCARGDEAAWVEMHRRYERLVWSIARSFFRRDHATAEDVACAVWAKLVTECGSGIRHIGGWLHRVTYNEAVSAWRARRRVVVSDAFTDGCDPASVAPDEAVIEAEARAAVVSAFLRLPNESQNLLRVLVLDDVGTYADKAAVLGCPRGSLGPRRARSLEHLARLVESELALMSRTYRAGSGARAS